jgi:hypothetical protein
MNFILATCSSGPTVSQNICLRQHVVLSICLAAPVAERSRSAAIANAIGALARWVGDLAGNEREPIVELPHCIEAWPDGTPKLHSLQLYKAGMQ